MKTLDLNDQIEIPKEPEIKQRFEARDIYKTFQGTLTPIYVGGIDATYGLEELSLLANLRYRSIEIETVLINFGLIKGTYSP